MDKMTLPEYLALSCSDKTIRGYLKTIRTLRRKNDPEAHISALSPQTQRTYRTAWNHYQGYLAYVGEIVPEASSTMPQSVREAIQRWGKDPTLLHRSKVRNTSPRYSGLTGFIFYGEGEDIISIPKQLADLLERHSSTDYLLDPSWE